MANHCQHTHSGVCHSQLRQDIGRRWCVVSPVIPFGRSDRLDHKHPNLSLAWCVRDPYHFYSILIHFKYSPEYYRAVWISTGLDAGFATALNIRPKWLRDLASIVFSIYYILYPQEADEKVIRPIHPPLNTHPLFRSASTAPPNGRNAPSHLGKDLKPLRMSGVLFTNSLSDISLDSSSYSPGTCHYQTQDSPTSSLIFIIHSADNSLFVLCPTREGALKGNRTNL